MLQKNIVKNKTKAKGREEGIKEGEEKKAKEIAIVMKTPGLPIEKISEITNLSKEEIDEL
jgi:predicted transposase/invertase (TIGR01784 family)